MIEFSDMNSVLSSVAGVFLVEAHAVSGGQEGLSRCGLMGNQVLARVNNKTVVQLGSSSSWLGIVRSRCGFEPQWERRFGLYKCEGSVHRGG